MVRAIGTDAALKDRLVKDSWSHVAGMFAVILENEGGHDDVLKRFRADPAFVESIALARAADAKDPSFTIWRLGQFIGDSALQAKHREVLTRRSDQLWFELDHHLDISPANRAIYSLYKAAKAKAK